MSLALQICQSCGQPSALSNESAIKALRSDNQEYRTFFQDLLKTNTPPPKDEIPRSVSDIRAAEERLQLLELHEQQLKSALDQIHEEKKALREKLHLRRIIASPLRRFTKSLIAKIILHAMPSNLAWNPLDMDEIPWVASHVSSLWREAVLYTPELWYSIQVDFSHPDHQWSYMSDSLRILDETIRRAGDHTLTFSFVGEHHNQEDPTDEYLGPNRPEDVLRVFLGLSERWEDASFHTVSPSSAPLFERIRGRLQNLKRLVWMGRCHGGNAFSIAPELREACISLSCLDSLPWPQLKQLKFQADEASSDNPNWPIECLRIVQYCAELQQLGIFVAPSHAANAPRFPATNVTLDNLRGLKCPEFFLDAFTAPELHTLALTCNPDSSHFTLPQFISRSACKLQGLSLSGSLAMVGPSTVIDAFKLSPKITALRMRTIEHELDRSGPRPKLAEIVQQLHFRRLGNTILPELQYLDLNLEDDAAGDKLIKEGWVQMVESRSGGKERITTLILRCQRSAAKQEVFRTAVNRLKAKRVNVILV
ncbi:hypothetical protein C8J56DRAFT_972231 [Mycena floridula]|nr:hypothetical protein C8J56DRAFT_972231 [Mycena floridula]